MIMYVALIICTNTQFANEMIPGKHSRCCLGHRRLNVEFQYFALSPNQSMSLRTARIRFLISKAKAKKQMPYFDFIILATPSFPYTAEAHY